MAKNFFALRRVQAFNYREQLLVERNQVLAYVAYLIGASAVDQAVVDGAS